MQTRFSEIVLSAIAKSGLIVTFSQENQDLALRQLRVLYENGVSVVEYMSRTPQSESIFPHLLNWKNQFAKDCFLGIGTIKSSTQLEVYTRLHADFFVSPMYITNIKKNESRVYIPGVSTPGEIWSVIQQGFSVCKIFPANCLGGPEYIKSMNGPFPEIRFIPSGGIGLDEELIMRYQQSGALCVSLGGSFWVPLTLPFWETEMALRTKQSVKVCGEIFCMT